MLVSFAVVRMSDDIVSLFDQLTAETSPRHLPVAGVAYKFVWTDEKYKNDWKADWYRWRNQGAAKKIMKYADVGLKKTFFHVSLVCMLSETENHFSAICVEIIQFNIKITRQKCS